MVTTPFHSDEVEMADIVENLVPYLGDDVESNI